jgi:hypothetical protein
MSVGGMTPRQPASTARLKLASTLGTYTNSEPDEPPSDGAFVPSGWKLVADHDQ